MARLGFLIQAGPDRPDTHISAQTFIQAAATHHEIAAVFFYGPAVLLASATREISGSGIDLTHSWQQLGVPLWVCSTAARRWGIQADSTGDPQLHPDYIVSSLAEWGMQCQRCERIFTW